jgi:GT2 family glycosyltransferase
VIIPTRDRADLLKQCLSSLWSTTANARSSGLDLEILVVDNGSVEEATAALLKEWSQRIRVLSCDEPFNWSRLNNLAAAQAKGDLLLLLNNDIEATQSGWIEAMAAQALRPAVGAVGALLLYPDGTIQHGGVVVGMPSGADHAYRDLQPDHDVHRGRSRLLTGWGAVTGACLMLRKELLERVGGLDEGLPVEFNDVDLCLRLSQLGYRCMIPPEAVLVHHESQSRDAKESRTALQALLRVQGRWPGRFSSAAPWWPAQSERNCADGRPLGLEGLPV